MHELSVLLTNVDGLRLTLPVFRDTRSTADENEGRMVAEQMANLDHAKYGPWTASWSRWVR